MFRLLVLDLALCLPLGVQVLRLGDLVPLANELDKELLVGGDTRAELIDQNAPDNIVLDGEVFCRESQRKK
jgi:hypothetical protein